MSQVKPFQKVSLVINIVDPLNWSGVTLLEKTHFINAATIISRDFSITLEIMRQLTSVEQLTVVINDSTSCDIKPGLRASKPVELSTLYHLELEHSDANCDTLFTLLKTTFRIINLRQLRIKNTLLTRERLACLQSIIDDAREEIKVFELIKTEVKLPIFADDIGTMPKLTNMYFDIINDRISENLNIEADFHLRFPVLENFTSVTGAMPFDKFEFLLNCKTLENLSVTVIVPSFQNVISFGSVTKSLPSLLSTQLFFNFTNQENCQLTGCAEARRKNKYFRCASNCFSSADMAYMQKVLDQNSTTHAKRL